MSSRIFTMRQDDRALEFGDVEVDQSEPNETLVEIDDETWLLSPWAMRYTGDEDREQAVVLDALYSFWILRGNSFFTERPVLEIQGIIQNHPDFQEGVKVTIPFTMLVRTDRKAIEMREHSALGTCTHIVAHDKIEAITPTGLSVVFYSDESMFRLGGTYAPNLGIIV